MSTQKHSELFHTESFLRDSARYLGLSPGSVLSLLDSDTDIKQTTHCFSFAGSNSDPYFNRGAISQCPGGAI